MAVALIGLGANLGEPDQALLAAIDYLRHSTDISVDAVSPFLESKAVGGPPGQPAYLNGAARLTVRLSPQQLLDRLHQIEAKMGRMRDVRWSARPIDLDLLLYDDLICGPTMLGKDLSLRIPHPRMSMRRFVLEPALAVAPQMVHPEIEWTVAELGEHLHQALPYTAICGFGKKKFFDQIISRSARRQGVSLLKTPVGDRSEASFEQDRLPASVAIEFFLVRLKVHEQAILQSKQGSVLSDFWVGQSLLPLGDEASIELERAKLSRLIPPKLLVMLWDSPSKISEGKRSATLARLKRLYRGPLLVLDATSPDRCVDEITAALASSG